MRLPSRALPLPFDYRPAGGSSPAFSGVGGRCRLGEVWPRSGRGLASCPCGPPAARIAKGSDAPARRPRRARNTAEPERIDGGKGPVTTLAPRPLPPTESAKPAQDLQRVL